MKYSHLFALLKQASRLNMTADAARAAGAAAGLLLAAFLLAVLADVLFAFHPWALAAADLLLALLAAAGLGYLAVQVRRNWFHPLRVARLVEKRLGIHDSRLINAVEFSSAPAASPSVSAALRQEAIERGEALARRLSPASAVEWKPVRRAALALGAVAIVALAAWLAAPNVFARVLPRLLDPAGNHPPFTLVTFDVAVEPEAIYYGQPAKIAVKLGGPTVPEQAEVVFVETRPLPGVAGDAVEQPGGGLERAPMLPEADGRFSLAMERAQASRTFYIDTPEGRSDLHTLTVLPTPRIESAKVELDYPAYAEWPRSESPLDGSTIRALEGTKATITLTANLPLEAGILELSSPSQAQRSGEASTSPIQTIKLRPLATQGTLARTVRGAFRIRRGGHYRVFVRASGGAPGDESISGLIECLKDKPPQVAIVSPQQHVLAVEGWRVDVDVQASDDVGVSRLGLTAGVNGFGPYPLEIENQRSAAGASRGRHSFDLGALGARAGDVITYFASAYDNRPSQKQFTDSPTHVIQVISEEDYLEFARSRERIDQIHEEFNAFRERLEQLAQQRAEALAELDRRKQELSQGDPPSAEALEKLQTLAEQVQRFGDQTEELARQLAERAAAQPLYDFEQGYQQLLAELAKQLEQQSAVANDLAEKLNDAANRAGDAAQAQSARQALAQAAEEFQKHEQPFDSAGQQSAQQTADDLAQLAQADELLAQARRMQSIVQRQRQLADRLGQFRHRQPEQPAAPSSQPATPQAQAEPSSSQPATPPTQPPTPMNEAGSPAPAPDRPASAPASPQTASAELSLEERQRMARLAKEQDLLRQELEETLEKLEQAAHQAQGSLPKMSQSARAICQAVRQMEIPGDQQSASRASRAGKGKQAFQSAESAAEKLASLGCEQCNGEGASEEMGADGPLGLSKEGLKQALRQMAAARGMPRWGKGRQGQGRGQGQGEGQGAGQGQGGVPSQGEGEYGDGSQSQLAQVTVIGPPLAGRQTMARSGRRQGEGRSREGELSGEAVAQGAESLVPESRSLRQGGPQSLRGVPAAYRDQAEAYFRRLAEEK